MKNMTMAQLRDERIAAENDLAEKKKILAGINAEIEMRVKPIVNGFGTQEREVDGIKMKINVPKKVEWDQDALAKLNNDIKESGTDPSAYIKEKVTFDVSEIAYKAWSDELKEAFAPARSEKTGTIKIEFMEE